MSTPLALISLLFGFGFLFFAIRGAVVGQLPTQASVVVRSRVVRRDEEPYVIWFNFLIYLAAGAALSFVALRALAS